MQQITFDLVNLWPSFHCIDTWCLSVGCDLLPTFGGQPADISCNSVAVVASLGSLAHCGSKGARTVSVPSGPCCNALSWDRIAGLATLEAREDDDNNNNNNNDDHDNDHDNDNDKDKDNDNHNNNNNINILTLQRNHKLQQKHNSIQHWKHHHITNRIKPQNMTIVFRDFTMQTIDLAKSGRSIAT